MAWVATAVRGREPLGPSGTQLRRIEHLSLGSELDQRRYGFVSAGGGEWFSRTLRSLPVGARVFACIPKAGYVGVGRVSGEATRFDETTLRVDGRERKMSELDLQGSYIHQPPSDTDATAVYVVPIEWTETRPKADAIWQPSMFANQNSACKLRNKFTLDQLEKAFGIGDDQR